MEHESDGDTNSNWRARSDPQRLCKRAGTVGNPRTNREHPNYSIIEIGQNTEKRREVLRRLVVTQPLLKDCQLSL